jgi:hypothetical protein
MEAQATNLRWFNAGFELRDLPRRPGSPHDRVELWLGAADRAEAARMLIRLEERWIAEARRPRRVAHRQPLAPVRPEARDQMHPDLVEVARRPWAVIEGCLTHDLPDADVIALELLELSGGSTQAAEGMLNRVHLWDLLDEDDTDPSDDLALAAGLAGAWQAAIDRVPGAGPVVVELHASAEGPHLTAFRCTVPGASQPASGRAGGSRMPFE